MSRLRNARLLAAVREEVGQALVLAIAIMMVLLIGTISVIGYSMSNETSARRSNKVQQAFNLAESGINNGVGIMNNPANQSLVASGSSSLFPPSTSNNPYTYTYDTGTTKLWGDWTGVTDPTGTLGRGTWHLKATGYVTWNHTGRTDTISRTVRVDVPYTFSLTQPATEDGWQYIYSKNVSGSAYNLSDCNETVYNGINVVASMYVAGNLCMNNPSTIEGAGAGNPNVDIIVRGWVEMDNFNNNNIGTATPVHSVQLGSGCGQIFNKQSSPTPTSLCKLPAYPFNPAAVSPGVPIPAPNANFVAWYWGADPGPTWPGNGCSSWSGTPPIFDNNGVQDLSIQGSITAVDLPATNGVVDLTPSGADYDCKGSDGFSEIKWTRSTKTLLVNGTIYVDGSVTASSTPVQYSGQGVVYASGTFLLKNAILCAYLTAAKTGCDTAAWMSASNPPILMFAAAGHGTGGNSGPYDQVAHGGDSIEIKSSWFQGGLYGAQTIEIDTSSNMQGPMVAGTEIISQSAGAPFPHFLTLPAGTPSNPIVNYTIESPRYYSGG